MSGPNLRVQPSGKRRCRTCANEQVRRCKATRGLAYREKARATARRWRANNPDKVLAQKRRHCARKRAARTIVRAYTGLIVDMHDAGRTVAEIAKFTASNPMAVSQTLVATGRKIGAAGAQ